MKTLLIIVAILLVVGGLVIFKLRKQPALTRSSNTPDLSSTPGPSSIVDAQLSEALKKLCDTSGGRVSVAVVHIETGKSAVVDGSTELPLFSVFKLPLAIAVLKDVEEEKLKLDQEILVTPEDLVAGSRVNTERWLKPVEYTIQELLELSIVESDNTSSDKLLKLVGGPNTVTERMRSFDLQQIYVRTTIKEYVATRTNPNTGSALGLVKLLSRLQRGELLRSAETALLIGMMERAKTGLRRLRGNLPPGTRVADKTGSGDLNTKTNVASSTNDVGLITLPNGRGHLAMAVLLRDSTLADEQQEKLVADLARTAFDAYSSNR